jgi:HSP20 family protein
MVSFLVVQEGTSRKDETRKGDSEHRKEETEEKGKTYHRVERRAGAFSRSIPLPCPVKERQLSRHGVLAIAMPKMEEAKAKKIEVMT